MNELTEAQIKNAVEEYLQYQMNLGKLWFTRLNSGIAYVKKGGKYYAIKLCAEGTADLEVVQGNLLSDGVHATLIPAPRTIFLEVKSAKGKQTKEQKEFAELVRMQGADYFVVREVEEVWDILEG